MMMGFADVPIEIHRARKPKGAQDSLSQKGESSAMGNGIEAGQRSTSRANTPLSGVNHQAMSSPAFDRSMNVSETLSKHSTSPSDTDLGDLDAASTYTREGSGRPLSLTLSEAPNPAESAPKKSLRILQTSNGVFIGTSKAVGKILVAGFKSPFEVSLSAARGFHNVPRYYGDDTVRPHERITGVWSGLKAAGKVSGPHESVFKHV